MVVGDVARQRVEHLAEAGVCQHHTQLPVAGLSTELHLQAAGARKFPDTTQGVGKILGADGYSEHSGSVRMADSDEDLMWRPWVDEADGCAVLVPVAFEPCPIPFRNHSSVSSSISESESPKAC